MRNKNQFYSLVRYGKGGVIKLNPVEIRLLDHTRHNCEGIGIGLQAPPKHETNEDRRKKIESDSFVGGCFGDGKR